MRKEWVTSTRKNRYDEVRLSTVEKYPDPVHFIYELLQNAEDQEATETRFELTPNFLIFSHNGLPFTRADVENITGIGNSNKLQEANKIGRFGIGFKSVFAVTDRPEISTVLEDRPFAFAIENLVIPVIIDHTVQQGHHWQTTFFLPFKEEQKAAIYSRIREKLSSLGFETLLFLQHLTAIEWQAETDDGIYLCEMKNERRVLSEETRKDGQTQRHEAEYLVFSRQVDVGENDRSLDVRLAFRLDEQGKIIAEPGQKLFVYFPTEQLTGLNFRLHGPLLLTDNRATIKLGNEINSALIQECAVLLGESIQKIKEVGLLTVDFLSMLPIRKESIPEVFHPLFEQVLLVLKQHPLLPTAEGTFASADEAKIARSSELRELLNERQLTLLYGSSSRLSWLSSEITQDKTRDLYTYITGELDVEVVDPGTVVRKVEKDFLQGQTDDWLRQLYKFLSKQPGLDYVIKRKPIIRLESNIQVLPFEWKNGREEPNAYLLREGESELPLVKKSLLTDEEAYAFLKRIRLSEPDIVDEVQTFILPRYEEGKLALEEEQRYQQDLTAIQKALQSADHRARHDLLDRLKRTPFLRAINAKTEEKAWKAPSELYKRTDELQIWFEGNEQAWFLADDLPLPISNDLNIRANLQPKAREAAAGTRYVSIANSHGYHARGLHQFDPDASLDGLEFASRYMTHDKAKILWRILLGYHYLIRGVVETSTYQDFRNARSTEKLSSIGQLCSQVAWLPYNNGDFCIPEELYLADLPNEFEKSTNEAYELAMKLGMRKAEEFQLADKLGIPQEIILLIQREPETFLALFQEWQQKKVSLPSSLANDIGRRRERATEGAGEAREKTYRTVSMSRRVSAEQSEVRAYLRGHNTNQEERLICQFCNHPMPFKLPDGEEYFEAYQYADTLSKEYEANHLALCPNCAAEFAYACQTDEDEKTKLILQIDPAIDEKELIVHLDMPEHQALRFTQRHLIDLQAVIRHEHSSLELT